MYTSFLFKYVSDQFMAEKMEIYVPESIKVFDSTERSEVKFYLGEKCLFFLVQYV